MTAAQTDSLIALGSGVTRNKRVAIVVKAVIAAGVWWILFWTQLSSDERDLEPLLMLARGAAYVLAQQACHIAVERWRRGTVMAYIAAIAKRDRGGLSLEIRTRPLTRSGRVVVAVAVGAVVAAGLGTSIHVIESGTFVAVIAFAAVTLILPALGALTVRDFIQLDASPTGLLWFRDAYTSDDVPWTAVRRITRRTGLSGSSVIVDWQPAVERARYPTTFVERASGEIVDLATVALAVRPTDWTERRVVRFLRIEWILEPIGALGP